jgi:hypothetical protein
MESLVMFIAQPQSMNSSSWVSRVTYIKYGFYLGLLIFLFSSTQAAAQDESTKTPLPPMITYKHNGYSFGVPQGWRVETTQHDAVKSILIDENLADGNLSATLVRLKVHASRISPQDLVRQFIHIQGYENLRLLNEVPEAGGYLMLGEWTNKSNGTGKGLYFAYREDDNHLVLIGFSAPRERFKALGGSALPITVFKNPWIKLDKAS